MKRGCRLALLAAAILAMAPCAGAATRVAVGDTPPDALGRNPDGRAVRISDSHGRIVVVSFWASWCNYCLQELPVLAGLQDAAGKQQMEVVAVDYRDDKDTYRKILRTLPDISLTMTHDATGSIGATYGVKGIPLLVIVGRDGKVAHVQTGYGEGSMQEMIDAVNALLAHPATTQGS